jgi:maleylpyruvate isomerase
MLKLYDYWRSGTSHRLRIALALKGLPYTQESVDLVAGGQHAPAQRARNPQGFVPVLDTGDALLTQSPTIIEWLEETHPEPPLLPRDPLARAKVRAIANVVACDIHPLGNQRVLKYLRDPLGHDDAAIAAWASRWIRDGFDAIEALISDGPGGAWCWGDAPTLADVCVAPQIYAATSRYGIDVSAWPRLAGVDRAAAAHPAFVAAHPTHHPDAR